MKESGLLSSYMKLPTTAVEPEEINILLVEDCETDSDLFKHLLGSTSLNAIITTVSSIAKARELLGKGKSYDCIFLDNQLPDGEGINFPYSLNPKLKFDNCFILLTGCGDESTGLTAIKQGMQDYVVKDSLNSNLLKSTILHSIERHKREIKDLEIFYTWELISDKTVKQIQTDLREIQLLSRQLAHKSASSSNNEQKVLDKIAKLSSDLDKDFNKVFRSGVKSVQLKVSALKV
ncbi:MAG: response regulator [Chlamydiales bacterium]|nr:response regulator [Chlamydiales bacterium]